MRIVILVEGNTERVFKPFLIAFLRERLADKMPNLDMIVYDGRIPKGDKLRRVVEIFSIGRVRGHYVKPRDAKRILEDAQRNRQENVLLISAQACPELKAFLNTILRLCAGAELP